MNADALITRLERMPGVVRALVSGLPLAEANFKPPDGAWSILEIVNHLADEDREDFRLRLKSTLENPSARWPPNDPEAWALQRRYNEQELGESLARFERERRESVRWLRSLGETDWQVAYQHPKAGTITAGELLVSWAAHDALHIRQIAKRLFELAARDGAPEGFGTRYAGEWKA